tara:strand:+ start:368 stop:622 length:255 start_codon:yes stop_codon:yes gene_type:complete
MKDKYLILELHKFNTFNDVWSVKYFNQTYDQAFEKLVCLEKLNEDSNIIYYLMPCEHLWTYPEDKKESEKIKTAQEKDQDDLPF